MKSVQFHSLNVLTPEIGPPVPAEYEAGNASIGCGGKEKKYLSLWESTLCHPVSSLVKTS
jgi:hypothetical protein